MLCVELREVEKFSSDNYVITFLPTGNLAQFPIRWEIETSEGFPHAIEVRTGGDWWRGEK